MAITRNTIVLISNNPAVTRRLDSFKQNTCDRYVDVLFQARNAIHSGARLLTHPLAGSVKPGESPYRSIAVSDETGELDMRSLEVIEGAIDRCRTLTEHREPRVYPESTLDDFQLIDYNLLLTGLEATLGGPAGVPRNN